jgi:hypothetical protein
MTLHEDAAEPRLTIDLDALAANYRRLRDLPQELRTGISP